MRLAQNLAAGKATLLKRAGAIILVLSLFFPMHSCTTYQVQPAASQTAKPVLLTQTQYFYVLSSENAKEPSTYLALLAFLWPAIAICLKPFQSHRRLWWIMLLLTEVALSIGTGLMIYWLGWGGLDRPEAGAYIAACGLALYLTARSIEIIPEYGKLQR